MIELGSVLNGGYRIQEMIGAGGGGEVYKARHLNLDKEVVVKRIKDDVKDIVYGKQEAEILKNLKHPNLPIVYDFIQTDEGIYTVMDFIEGEALDKILSSKRKITQSEVIKWGRQLSDALSYLHKQNPAVIHSDIKPANIIINPNGDATLIDFNVSIAFDDSAKFSVGISAGYAPPEQYRDIATYKKITNISNIQGTNTEKIFSMIFGETEQLPQSQSVDLTKDVQKTVYLMQDPENKNPDKTELLEDNLINNKTELLKSTDILGTEILDKTEGTLLLKTGSANAAGGTEIVPHFDGTEIIKKPKVCVDTRSDVYSLGCVLYHLITGVAPSVDFNAIKPLNSEDMGISEGLVLIVNKMMALSPAERYQNGSEVFDAISNIYKLDHRYIQLKRKEKVVAIASAALLFLGAGTLGFGIHQSKVEADAAYENQILSANTLADNLDYQAAIDLVKELQEDSPSKLKAYEREVYYLYMSGNYEEAMDRVEKIFADQLVVENGKNNDDIGNLYGIMGNCAYELEDYLGARTYIEQAIEYVEDNPTYYRDYAVSLAKLGAFDEAESALAKAIELGMDDTSMNYVNAEIESAKGNYENAVALLEEIINGDKNNDIFNRALLLAANDYIALEQYDKALPIFEQIYDSGVQTYQVQENIAYLYSMTGDLTTAENILLECADKYPNNYRVYKRLAVLEVKKQDIKPNASRDYHQMKAYYDKAFELYEQTNVEDSEMEVLKAQMQNVIDGGWL